MPAFAVLSAVALLLAPAPATLPAHNSITPPDRGGAPGRYSYVTGNLLLEYCQKSENACIGYIQGVVDGQLAAITGTSRDVAYCIPDGSTTGQVKDVVVGYLTKHPESRHELAGILVAAALAQAWPQCR